jgi:hypothetical protein
MSWGRQCSVLQRAVPSAPFTHLRIGSDTHTLCTKSLCVSLQDQLAEKAKALSVRTFTLANAVVGAPATKAS